MKLSGTIGVKYLILLLRVSTTIKEIQYTSDSLPWFNLKSQTLGKSLAIRRKELVQSGEYVSDPAKLVPSRLKKIFRGFSFIKSKKAPISRDGVDKLRRQHRVFFGVCYVCVYLH